MKRNEVTRARQAFKKEQMYPVREAIWNLFMSMLHDFVQNDVMQNSDVLRRKQKTQARMPMS